MASMIAGVISTLLEFDEVDVKRVGNKVTYKILTNAVRPKMVETKMLIWSYLSPPVKKLTITNIQEIERGPLVGRYLVTAVGDVRSGAAIKLGKFKIRGRRVRITKKRSKTRKRRTRKRRKR